MIYFLMVALLACAGMAGIIYVGFGSANTAVRQYDQQLNVAANSKLEEMFIFVDARQLRRVSAIVFIVAAIFAYFIFGSLVAAVIASLLVAFLPAVSVKFLKKRRMKRFNADLPDALQSSANMLRSGLNLVGALEFIVDDGKGPIPQEFGLFLRELKMGVGYDKALDNMFQRVPIADLQLVIAGMKISREVGGSLADTIRRRIEMEGKIDSLTSMGKLQGIVMTLLPAGVGYAIYKIEPEAMSKMLYHWTGWICLAVIITLELLGYLTIRKIVTIDV